MNRLRTSMLGLALTVAAIGLIVPGAASAHGSSQGHAHRGPSHQVPFSNGHRPAPSHRYNYRYDARKHYNKHRDYRGYGYAYERRYRQGYGYKYGHGYGRGNGYGHGKGHGHGRHYHRHGIYVSVGYAQPGYAWCPSHEGYYVSNDLYYDY